MEKDDILVLKGDRNLTDGLWGIPILYFDVYKRQYRKIITFSTKEKKELHTTKMLQHIPNLEDLIEVNECNYEVDRKLKIDRC